MKYTDHQDQLAKMELLLDAGAYDYTIKMSRKDRLRLIKDIHQRRA